MLTPAETAKLRKLLENNFPIPKDEIEELSVRIADFMLAEYNRLIMEKHSENSAKQKRKLNYHPRGDKSAND
jgi:uncharacterized tellurite resistance protein B-like protein